MLYSYRSTPEYRKKQSIIAKKRWKEGLHGHQIRPLQTRVCKNKDCNTTFSVKPYDPKVFCSKSCAVYFNNLGRKHTRQTKLKIANSLSPVFITVLKSEIKRIPRPSFLPFDITHGELRRLYADEKLNSSEIAKKFNVSVFRVIKKLKKYEISRRTSAASNRIRFLKSPLTFNKKTTLTLKEKALYIAGLMLYWAEGAKRGNNSKVDLANSDPYIAKLFIMMLRQVYRVRESKLRASIYAYSNLDINNLTDFWSKVLNLRKDQFYNPYIRYDFKNDKIGTLKYGVIHVVYVDQRLHMQIMKDIGIISRQILSQGGGVVDRSGL